MLEVGEYGRTNTGKIFIFVYVENANYILIKTRNEHYKNSILNFDKYYLHKNEEIVKHSKNIIDLIEIGDYVNGYIVLDVTEDLSTGELHLEMQSNCPTPECNCQLYNKDIKSIVTKEQFANIEYKVNT